MNIVGYKSPFKKKKSPMRLGPVATQVAIAAAPGILSAIGGLFGRKKRRREQARAREEYNKAKAAFENIQYVNPYKDLTNPYAGLQNPYTENLYEDLGVNTRAADYLREQQQQSQANIMQQYRGVAGGSGVGGLAQAMANISDKQAREASINIAQQERANEALRIQGEQQKRTAQFGLDKLQRDTTFAIDQAKIQGEMLKKSQEDARTEALYGLSLDRLSAANQARRSARSQIFAGLGQAIGGVTGMYADKGMRSGRFLEDFKGFRAGGFNY